MSIYSNIEKTLDNAEKLNETLNSFLTVEREYAIGHAEVLEKNTQVENQLLHGVSVAVKDNICTKFSQTSCGSRILGNYRPQWTGAVYITG